MRRHKSALQKNAWLSDNVYGPAARIYARRDSTLAVLQIVRDSLDRAMADGTYRRPAGRKARRSSDGGRASSGGEEELAFAFFSVAWDTMNPAQILEFEQEISGLDKSADYDVVGYADITTGSMSINNRLRRGRAATVVALLRERGFTGRLTPKISGGAETMFEIAWKNCAAVIRPGRMRIKLISRGNIPMPSWSGYQTVFPLTTTTSKNRAGIVNSEQTLFVPAF